MSTHTPDSDEHKGAVEQEQPRTPGSVSTSAQLPHRTADAMIKDNDTDFPEPGSNEEHSGQHSASR